MAHTKVRAATEVARVGCSLEVSLITWQVGQRNRQLAVDPPQAKLT